MLNKTQPSLSKQRLKELVQACMMLTEQLDDTADRTVATVIPAYATIVGTDVNLPPMKFSGNGGTIWQ